MNFKGLGILAGVLILAVTSVFMFRKKKPNCTKFFTEILVEKGYELSKFDPTNSDIYISYKDSGHQEGVYSALLAVNKNNEQYILLLARYASEEISYTASGIGKELMFQKPGLIHTSSFVFGKDHISLETNVKNNE